MTKKDNYEKPQLKGERLFEAGAKTCCKGAACTTSEKTGGGKSSNSNTTS
ncbi:MAG: hypothetical protein Q7J72_07545 [Candidatus Omnitrophota bacterium]|nr:hypothetical protein [Candidatus Omnitrophota bacterium]